MPSQSPPGWVRNVVKSTVNVPTNAAKPQPQASMPTARTGRSTCSRWRVSRTTMKNVPATKHVMNVVSLVAKLIASSAPISAGWCARGRSRKRKRTTSIAIVMQAM